MKAQILSIIFRILTIIKFMFGILTTTTTYMIK